MLICEAVEPDGKSCSRCGQYKPLEAYNLRRLGKYGREAWCRGCRRDYYDSWYPSYAKGSPKKQSNRASRLKQLYGLTQPEWDAMWERQKGICPICTRPMERGTGKHATDHCHATGRVRAILHANCNKAMGLMFEDTAALRRMIDYIEAHRAST